MARIDFLKECDSTNLVLRDKEAYSHGDAVIAFRQTAGRGQRGNKWESTPGENLTFSVVLEPAFLPASQQFLLSEVVALSLTDTFSKYGIDARIKWTNDIYVGDRKITGVLLEHDLKGDNLSRTIVGIGINVNQTVFPEWIPNPTSMLLETGKQQDIHEVFYTCYDELRKRYEMLEGGDTDRIRADYHKLIYRRDEPRRFSVPGEGEVTGIIRGVEPDGKLLVEIEGSVRGFLFKEIEFIL